MHCRYEIMLNCWNEDPRKRPTFPELRTQFDAMLLAERNDEYIDLRINNDKPYYYMFDTSTTLVAANSLNPSPTPATDHHSILLSQFSASREHSPKPLPIPDFSPSHKSCTSSASVQFSPSTKQSLAPSQNSIGGHSSDAEGSWRRRDHAHESGRPSSLLLPRERERREKQDRYVDEPSRATGTTLALPEDNWSHTRGGSDGAIEWMCKSNSVGTTDNCEQKQAYPEIQITDEKS